MCLRSEQDSFMEAESSKIRFYFQGFLSGIIFFNQRLIRIHFILMWIWPGPVIAPSHIFQVLHIYFQKTYFYVFAFSSLNLIYNSLIRKVLMTSNWLKLI